MIHDYYAGERARDRSISSMINHNSNDKVQLQLLAMEMITPFPISRHRISGESIVAYERIADILYMLMNERPYLLSRNRLNCQRRFMLVAKSLDTSYCRTSTCLRSTMTSLARNPIKFDLLNLEIVPFPRGFYARSITRALRSGSDRAQPE